MYHLMRVMCVRRAACVVHNNTVSMGRRGAAPYHTMQSGMMMMHRRLCEVIMYDSSRQVCVMHHGWQMLVMHSGAVFVTHHSRHMIDMHHRRYMLVMHDGRDMFMHHSGCVYVVWVVGHMLRHVCMYRR